MSLKIRLNIMFAAIFFVVAFVGGYSIWRTSNIQQFLKGGLSKSITDVQNISKLDITALLIRYDDEVLTQSARNYAYTGDISWKERYDKYVPILDQRIKEALELGSDEDDRVFAKINDANLILVDLEIQAIKLADEGKLTAAQKILEGDKYEEQKAIYRSGIEEYLTRIGANFDEAFSTSTKSLNEAEQRLEYLLDMQIKILISYMVIIFIILITLFIIKGKVLGILDMEKKLNELKDEFVSLASHELRTPMTAIKGFTSMVLEGDYGKVPEKMKQPLNDIYFSTNRLISLVNDMLNLSRIEAGRLKYDLEEFDPSEVITKAADTLCPIAKEKGLDLQKGNLESATVFWDKDKLIQVINNLVGNSLKFTPKGYIKIYSQVKGEFYNVFVEDSGIGIAKENVDKIFGKFEQVTTKLSGKPEGTGLGLYLTKQIVKKLGGDVWIEKTEVGVGTTFGVSLPLANTDVAKRVSDQIKKEALSHPDQKDMS